MKKYLLALLWFACTKVVQAQEIAYSPAAKPKLGVLITSHVGGFTEKKQTQALFGPQTVGWEQQSNLKVSLMASKSVVPNLYIGAGLGYATDVFRSLPGNRTPCSNCGFASAFVINDYKVSQKSFAPTLTLEYLYPVFPNLFLSLSSYDRLLFVRTKASFLAAIYEGEVSEDGSGVGEQDGGGAPGTVSAGSLERNSLAINAGLMTSIRWSFSKYVGLQLSTGGVQFTKEVSDPRYPSNKQDSAWLLEVNFEPRNWMLGVYAHF